MWISMVRVVPEHMWKETIGTSRRDILGFGEESYSLKGPLVFHSEQFVGVILLYFHLPFINVYSVVSSADSLVKYHNGAGECGFYGNSVFCS